MVTGVKRKIDNQYTVKNWYSCVTRPHATCVKWVIPEKKIQPTPVNDKDFFYPPAPDFPAS